MRPLTIAFAELMCLIALLHWRQLIATNQAYRPVDTFYIGNSSHLHAATLALLPAISCRAMAGAASFAYAAGVFFAAVLGVGADGWTAISTSVGAGVALVAAAIAVTVGRDQLAEARRVRKAEYQPYVSFTGKTGASRGTASTS
jgi:hypothetical protein